MRSNGGVDYSEILFKNEVCGFAIHELIVDENGNAVDYIFLKTNQVFEEQTGLVRDNVLGQRVTEIIPGIEDTGLIKIYGEVVRTGKSKHFTSYIKPLDKWFDISVHPLSQGKFATNFFDITERKDAEERLKQKNDLLQDTLDGISDALLLIAPDGKIKYLNQTAEKIPGIEDRECIGKDFREVFFEQIIITGAIREVMKTGRNISFEYTFEKTGFHFRCEINPVYSNKSELQHIIVHFRDISISQAREEKLRYIKFHDSLSGLYNRNYFLEEMNRLDTERQLPLSVIIADINGLKVINDSFGHQRGDEFIRNAAEAIKECCREEDVIARWGGDEFAVLLPQTPEEVVAEKIECITKKCRKIKINEIPLTMAFGYATKKEKDQQLEDIIQQADDYMYKNKLVNRESIRGDMLNTLLKTLEVKSNETERHSLRMVQLTLMFGEALNLSADQLDKLSLIATLHDIGKIAISEDILKKPSALNDREWIKIKNHPRSGYNIVKSSEGFAHVADEILSHHERWDGEGYPRKLQGEEIPLLARIISIVDAYDVMTNGRPYKEARSKGEAIEELYRCAGKQFDPELVEIFINLIN